MYGCEVMWGDDRAVKVQALVEESLGDLCPCKRGLVCPVLPRDMELPEPTRPFAPMGSPLLRSA